MRIAVIDGQGGGIGKMIVEKLKSAQIEGKVIALGTNALATAQMIKAGADEGATGENAIVFSASRVDYILGPMGIIMANAMLGELTPLMAKAVGESPARKILIPINKCLTMVAGVKEQSMGAHIDEGIAMLINDISLS